mgnify:FL=1
MLNKINLPTIRQYYMNMQRKQENYHGNTILKCDMIKDLMQHTIVFHDNTQNHKFYHNAQATSFIPVTIHKTQII